MSPYDVDGFPEFNRSRFETWRYTMNATATHDTRRGEDMRVRLNVLAKSPDSGTRPRTAGRSSTEARSS